MDFYSTRHKALSELLFNPGDKTERKVVIRRILWAIIVAAAAGLLLNTFVFAMGMTMQVVTVWLDAEERTSNEITWVLLSIIPLWGVELFGIWRAFDFGIDLVHRKWFTATEQKEKS